MITLRKHSARLLVVAALGMSLMALSNAPAWANPSAPTEAKQDWAKQRQEWLKKQTDKLADRLEIKASQQGAWQAYVKTLETVAQPPAKKPEIKSDAASIARLHADFAAIQAQKLAQIADATAKLQAVLNPDQRKTLDQIATHAGQHMRHGHEQHWQHGEGQWNHDKQGGDAGADQKHEHENNEQH